MSRRAPQRILVIVQRSNGDVFLSSPLIEALYHTYGSPDIDLLVNSDTLAIARTLPHIREIHQFSYTDPDGRWRQTSRLIGKIARNYDLSINLTTSDRSVVFAMLSGSISISAVEQSPKKSWWKRRFLSAHYEFDRSRHIIQNNTAALGLLGIEAGNLTVSAHSAPASVESVEKMLADSGITDFVIFHPGAQYEYKVYPEAFRKVLLERLDRLGVPVVVTGSKSAIDQKIKASLPRHANVHDFIGRTSMEELIALSDRSLAYIGADTLNMHIAAAQDKRIFTIFGPTVLSTWSPWSNGLHACASVNRPVQTYGNVTVFQADMPCAGCGKTGCDDQHGVSECLYNIEPDLIAREIERWMAVSGLAKDG
ncbi:MAG: glycosyltransferase family 9 protein [Chlorobiaceae bacterium]|nr:glycosyltransferase family 9 protein [Chlorobiaceae bacterium]